MKNLNVVSKTKTYEKPVLREHGSIEKITQGGKDGTFLDFDFVAGTPATNITFS